MSSIGTDAIEAQFANACDRDDLDGLRRVRKVANVFAGKLTGRGKYAEAAHVRRIRDTAAERINKTQDEMQLYDDDAKAYWAPCHGWDGPAEQ
jgi:hypothetical protein